MEPNVYPVAMAPAEGMSLRIRWSDGHESLYPPGYLRFHCACAHCVDEVTGVRRIRPEDIPPDIHPLRADPVGRYAIQITWSDGHSGGIYTFERLRAICFCPDCAKTPSAAGPQPKGTAEDAEDAEKRRNR
jgi:DUF971 family protein